MKLNLSTFIITTLKLLYALKSSNRTKVKTNLGSFNSFITLKLCYFLVREAFKQNKNDEDDNNDNDDNDDNDHDHKYSCISVNFQARTCKFCMEVD